MAPTTHGSTEAQLAVLEAEARALEAELAGLHAAIAALKAQREALARPEEGVSLPLSPLASPNIPRFDVEVEHPEACGHARASLQPLPLHDPLRAKWQLGDGLPAPAGAPHPLPHAHEARTEEREGMLRLSGVLEDGRMWEHSVPFSSIARPEGASLGRDPEEVDIVLPDNSISRRHALLEITDAGLVLTDLGSMNGTFVNEQVLTPCERRIPLAHGMTIGLGEARLRLDFIR